MVKVVVPGSGRAGHLRLEAPLPLAPGPVAMCVRDGRPAGDQQALSTHPRTPCPTGGAKAAPLRALRGTTEHVGLTAFGYPGSHGLDAADMPAILQLVACGRLDPTLLIERRVGLEEGARAIEAMDQASPLGITMVTRFR